ncbi:MAG TPA: hypothetical protein VG498_04055 [Terriglobales bacterium]|nr:hypothetical protein [Terriglobales bacterium]
MVRLNMSFVRACLCVLATLALVSCSRGNNLLLGRVEAKLGAHKVAVTDCYRIHAPQPILSADRYTYEPCRDAIVIIDHDRLTVNGTDYGFLGANDSVLVDHGVVSVGRNGVFQRAQR